MLPRLLLVAALLSASGCAAWQVPTYDMSLLRDPRAVDIDGRLSAPQPITAPRESE
ncbi:MAG: hypothetical protein ACR2NU_12690 [Aeoliella sp.]